MNQIVEIKLGLEGVSYVRECLSIGKALSHAALDALDLTAGVVTTFLPSGVPKEQILQFWSGGKLEEDMVSVERAAQTMRFGHVHTTAATFVELIDEHVNSDGLAFCILEDQMASPRDPWRSDVPAPALTDGQNLYYILTSTRTDRDAMRRTFNRAMSIRPPLIGFLGRGHTVDVLERQQVLPNDPVFAEMAASTEQILIGAYDGESFVRWQRGTHARA